MPGGGINKVDDIAQVFIGNIQIAQAL